MKKTIGVIFSILAITIFMFTGSAFAIGDSSFTANSVDAKINGGNVKLENQYRPYVNTENSEELMVPIYKLVPACGLKSRCLSWSKDHQTAIIVTEDGKLKVKITVGSNVLQVNDEKITMNVKAERINGIFFAPAHYIAKALGYNIAWDSVNRTVTMSRSEIVNTGYKAEGKDNIIYNYDCYTNYNGLRDFGATFGVSCFGNAEEVAGITQFFYSEKALACMDLTPLKAYNQYRALLLADGYNMYLDTNELKGNEIGLCILRNSSYQVKLLATDYLAVHVSRL